MPSERKRTDSQARILIVDDDPNTVEILRRWLAREGYATTTALGGAVCLEQLAKVPVDVILLDVMMPEMDGLEVCQRVRRNESWRLIPIILLTARDDIETRSRGMALGVSEYLTKPVNKQDLLERLRAQVHSRELERRLRRTVESIDKGVEG